MLGSLKSFLQKKIKVHDVRPAAEAYDIWSDSYDVQPDHLMLDLDELIFSTLLEDVDLANKTVADIGCGTGRHWERLYHVSPAILHGYDISEGMLNKLKLKFPAAITSHINDNQLSDTATASLDCIISTLTIAHIEELDETIAAWARVLKPGGDVILTDFHPDALIKAGRSTFNHNDGDIAIMHFVHSLSKIKEVCEKQGLIVARQEEKYIDESVRSYYEHEDAMHVYNQLKGMAIVYGLHLKNLKGE